MRAALLACALLSACGGATRGAGATSRATPDRTAAPPGWLDGQFRWTHASTDGAVHRVEIEDWWLGDGARYRRQVHVFSLDGVPFRCNQRLSYVIETEYDVAVRSSSSGATLDETLRKVTPSPCATEHRGTTRYQVVPAAGGALALTWPGGRQTLHRASASAAPAPAAAGPRYRWTNRSVGPRGDTRVEIESWELHEDGGSYQRRVVVFREDGRIHRCSGEATIDYTDRFEVEVHGTTLTEVAAHPAAHPCASRTRHLDSGELTIHGDGSLEILWRGGNRQVLAPVAPGQ
ncbi:MAG TPA: hypothetical protein VMZ28_09955 [Kofleriaceae bacterium]|nr:hypothetical protein [Kofleriaceae bacterium]